MAKIVKTLTVSWQWSGDKYSLRGFNLAVTPTAKNPKEEVVATAFVETKEIKQTYSYKMGNVTLDKDAQYKIWVQAVYENSDSDWVATGGATVSDDGSATIITKTDREIQDIVNMASDNILTRQEKISLRREWQEIVYEFLEIESTAISQGIPSSNTTFSNFKSKGNALGTYLNGGTAWTISSNNKTSFPLWINDSNLGNNTSINGNTYRETFRVYYEAKVKILEEINEYKVNNVQIGGTNLLTGTKDFNVGKGTGTVHSEKYNGFTVLYKDFSTATSGYSDVCAWNSAINVKQNTEYTLSFYAKGSGDINSYFYPNNVASGYSSEGKKTTATDGALTHTLTNNWKRYWIVWKTSSTTTGLKNVLPMRLLPGATGYICGVKFEEGNKATDWSPSLEEMENAYTIILTNEAQVIPTNSNRVPTSSTTYFTDIQVYQGTVQRNDYTIGTVNSANGITVSKTSSRVNFAVSTNIALAADGGNFTIPITIDGKTFNKTFSWSCSKQGNTGATGASGVGISKITEYYAVSSSNTTEPTSWSTTVPAMTATNKYLWNYETIAYSNNTTTNTSKRVIGVYGDKGNTGATGATGATGNGISKIVNYYLATSSSSGVTTSTSGWTTSVQAVSASKKYLWNYEVITYTNGSTSTTTPCIIGAYGDTGATGPAGQNAQHVVVTGEQVFKYANNFSGTPTPTTITLTATKINTTATGKWQWLNGSTWTDWSTDASTLNATTLSVSPTSGSLNTGKSIRIRYIVSSVYDEITLVKVSDGTNGTNGTNGADAYTVILTNETHTFPTQNNGNIPTALSTTTQVVAYKGASSITPTIGTLPSVTGLTLSKSGTTVSVQANTGTSLADSGSFNIPVTVDGKSFTKTFSWSKAKQGNTGATGNAGQDAITIILSNENHTFPCESNGNIPTALSTTCVVTAYKGGTSITPTIGAITNPTGMTITKNGATLTIQANTGTSLADSGTVNIPISVDGKTFNKTFTWSKAKKGATGATGATGAGAKTVDIIASSQVFKSTDGGITFFPATITLTPSLQNVTFSKWQYSTNGGSSWSNVSSGSNGLTVSGNNLQISKSSNLFTSTNTTVVFKVITNDSAIYDTMTIVKLYDVTELEIGGRNLLLDTQKLANQWNNANNFTTSTDSNGFTTISHSASGLTANSIKGFYSPKIPIDKIGDVNNPIVFSVDLQVENTANWDVQTPFIYEVYNSSGTRIGWVDVGMSKCVPQTIENKTWTRITYKRSDLFTGLSVSSGASLATDAHSVGIRLSLFRNGKVWYRKPKFEIGNIPTDWTPAPEDVDSNITDVKNSLNSFQNTVNTSFKDGIIEQAEAKAIAQHLKTLDAEKADIDKEYSTIYSNANLTGSAKTNLASAKTSFDSAHTSLKSTINTVISDGRVTSSESSSVTSTFNTYNTQLGVYKQRVQEALDNISSGKVDKVEVGGRNLARKGSVVKYNSNASATTVNDANFTTDGSATISRTAVVNEGAMIDRYVVYDGGANYVAAFKMRTTSGTVNSIHIYNGRGHKNTKVYIDGVYKGTMGQDLTFPNDTNYHKIEIQFQAVATDSATANAQNTSHIIPQPMKGTASAYTIQILNLKIEKGNKATDWTPAPEDVAANINTAKNEAINSANGTLTTTIANYYTKAQTDSQINVAKEAINLGVSNTYETKTNVETKVSSTLNSAKSYADTKKSEAISSASSDATTKANNALNSAKSYADTKKTEAISTASTDATNKVNAAKSELNTAINKKANSSDVYVKSEVYTKAQTDSQIKVAKDEINLGISNTYETKTNVESKISTAVNNVQIGGRNLMKDSKTTSAFTGFSGATNQTMFYRTVTLTPDIKAGDKIAVSLTYKYKNIVLVSGQESNARLYVQGSGNVTSWNPGFSSGPNIISKITKGNANELTYYQTYTFTLSESQATNQTFSVGLRADYIQSGSLSVYEMKVEKGSKPTAWTPAPEDVSKNISDAKTEAINTASNDATNKVNSAKSALNTEINKKANSADVYKKTEVYTKNETNSQITAAKNEITQSVSSTYETKTNVATKLNNLSVSATNLMDNSAPLSTSGWSNWSSVSGLSTNIEVSTTDNSTHGKQGKITFSGSVTGNAGRHKSPVQKLTSGKTYSWSIWLRSGSGNLTVQVGQEQNGLRDVTVGTSWTRFTHTYTANDNQYYAFIIRPKNVNSSHSLYFHSVMLVEGDKPVAWQTSPTEVLSDKTSIEQRMNSAEQKITETAITNTVKKNFYTKQETDNQITSKGYQTASQVQQTVNNLQIKFTETGGYNLIRNSSGLNGTSLWTGTATLGTATNTNIGGACDKYMYLDNGTTTSEQFAYSSRFKLKPSTKYTLTGWFHNYTKCPSFDVFVLSSTSVDSSDTGTSYTNVHHLIQAQNTNGAWKKYTVSFTTPSGCKSGVVRIDNNGYNANGSNSNRIHWSALILAEGALEVPWSPHPNEVYDGIIQMDKNGIKVSTSNGGWTDFTSVGMNVYNKSSQLSLGTRNGGLTYHSGGQYLGFTSASIIDAYNTRGVSISTATGGAYVTLGYSSATDPFGGFTSTACLSVAKQDIGDSSSFYRKGVNVHTTLNLNTQNINRMGTINFTANNTSKIYQSTANNLCMFGENGVVLGYREGDSNATKLEILEGSSDIRSYAHWQFNQWNLNNVGQLEVVSRLKMQGTSSIHFNASATYPSTIWHSSNDNKLNICGDNGVDIGYRVGDTNKIVLKTTEGEDGAYRIQSFSHWHFNNWNLDYVGNVHAQKFTVAGTSGSYYITKGTGDGADYTTYGCLFYTHNGLAFTANGGAPTVIVQGRSGRIMGKNAYYVNSSKCLKSDIRAVTSESEPMPVNLKQGEIVDETLTMEMIGDFIDTIGIRTYITDFEQEGATQKDVDPQQGHVLNLGYIADDLAHHPVFKYIGEKTPDNLYAISSNGLTTVALAGLQAERKERRKLEQRLQKLEAMLLKGEE